MFEFDPAKSASNLVKHGIDFEEAQKLWLDPRRIQFEAQSDLEPRAAMLAKLNSKVWFAVYTQQNYNTRMISERRARKKEEAIYEQN
jgi:uncharacterized protein